MSSDRPFPKKSPSSKPASYHIIEDDNGWIAYGSQHWRSLSKHGRLAFVRKTASFHAWCNEPDLLFQKLAKGFHNAEESPLDKRKRPKADFLFLFSLRQLGPESSPGRKCELFRWFKMAIDATIAESETERSEKLPPQSIQHAHGIAASITGF